MWEPQPGPQEDYINETTREVFFGGARGGGKTDACLGKALLKALAYGGAFNGVFFRREVPNLDDAIERSIELYSRYGTFNAAKSFWRFRNGARIRFRPLENIKDAGKYQGQNLTDIWIEEAGEYPDPAPIFKLWGALRSAHGVPTQMTLTGNPGGPGHMWLKTRYVDPAPGGNTIIQEKITLPGGDERTVERIFIPSRLKDNRILLDKDPDYPVNITQSGSEALVRAWLEGDWNAIDGVFFDCWHPGIVISPFEIPSHWPKFRSCDWGSAAPGCVGWWAVVQDDYEHEGRVLPRGALVLYREWYVAKKTSTGTYVGLKMTAEEMAQGILDRESETIDLKSVIDPSAFRRDGGPSIAERMFEAGVTFQRADNSRVTQFKDGRGPLGGWDRLRSLMKNNMIFCFDTCTHSIRTLPSLPHDPGNPEDLDTRSEDHAADMWRYAVMSRPDRTEEDQPKRSVEGFIDPGIIEERRQRI